VALKLFTGHELTTQCGTLGIVGQNVSVVSDGRTVAVSPLAGRRAVPFDTPSPGTSRAVVISTTVATASAKPIAEAPGRPLISWSHTHTAPGVKSSRGQRGAGLGALRPAPGAPKRLLPGSGFESRAKQSHVTPGHTVVHRTSR